MKKIIALLLSTMVLLGTLTACSEKDEAQNPKPLQQTQTPEPTVANPQAAIDEIYKEIDITGLESATSEILKDKFAMNLEQIEEFWVKYSSKNYGVADVFIIKPKAEYYEAIEEQLDAIKKQRITEFTNYDIYNSLQISKDALIYTHGDYVILLMVSNTGAAKEAISKYIPS